MSGGPRVKDAVVVAAGFGSRLQPLRSGGELIKPLEPVGGVPILKRVMDSAFGAGLERVVLVTGHMADRLEAAVRGWELAGPVEFVYNERYKLANGVSLLCGAEACVGPFVLLMSDHLFDRANLTGLLARGLDGDEAVLAVDHKVESVFDLDDATKVVTRGDRITRIGKQLTDYNAIDTGLFLLSQNVTQYLRERVATTGDASISDAMGICIEKGTMAGFDIGDGLWQDVDTPEMFEEATRLLGRGLFA